MVDLRRGGEGNHNIHTFVSGDQEGEIDFNFLNEVDGNSIF